jgi:hypothetical protein
MTAVEVEDVNLLNGSPKEREVRVGDKILHWATGYLRDGVVTKVTQKYIWIEYTSPSTGITHNTRRHREIALMYSKFY